MTIDGLEQRVFVSFDQAALRDIFSVKRLVLSLRRHLSPQREVLNQLLDGFEEALALRDPAAIERHRDVLASFLDQFESADDSEEGEGGDAD